jgi:hypothetical protein
MSTISINGNVYSGDNIVVMNGKVIINGMDVTPDSKEINITIEGNIHDLKVDACNSIRVVGNVNAISTKSGYVDVTGGVAGSIQTMSGSVDCGDVGGSISTMSGSVKHRKQKQ